MSLWNPLCNIAASQRCPLSISLLIPARVLVWLELGLGTQQGGRPALSVMYRGYFCCCLCSRANHAAFVQTIPEERKEGTSAGVLMQAAPDLSCVLGQNNLVCCWPSHGWAEHLSPLYQCLAAAMQVGPPAAGMGLSLSSADLHQLKAVVLWHPSSPLWGPEAGWPSVTVCY